MKKNSVALLLETETFFKFTKWILITGIPSIFLGVLYVAITFHTLEISSKKQSDDIDYVKKEMQKNNDNNSRKMDLLLFSLKSNGISVGDGLGSSVEFPIELNGAATIISPSLVGELTSLGISYLDSEKVCIFNNQFIGYRGLETQPKLGTFFELTNSNNGLVTRCLAIGDFAEKYKMDRRGKTESQIAVRMSTSTAHSIGCETDNKQKISVKISVISENIWKTDKDSIALYNKYVSSME
jgi:hypothetical protein